jgi:hypothetical protein
MNTYVSHTLRHTYTEGVVSVEVKTEDGYGTRYTIIVGPAGNPHNTRLELSQENWTALLGLIKELENF